MAEARVTLAQQMADHARGEKLRQLRSERGLSQEEVAAALGVTAKTYGAWERGGGIHVTNAKRIARYFRVKPGELIVPEIPTVPTVNGDGPAPLLGEQLEEINRKLDEILKRLPPPGAEPGTQDEDAGPEGPLPGDEDADEDLGQTG